MTLRSVVAVRKEGAPGWYQEDVLRESAPNWIPPGIEGPFVDRTIMSNYDAPPVPGQLIFHASSKITTGEEQIVSVLDWAVVDGVVSNPSFFAPRERIIGRLIGEAKAIGVGAKIRFVETDSLGASREIGNATIPDSANVWIPISFFTSLGAGAGSLTYTMESKLDGASAATLRFFSVSLLEYAV